MPSKRERQHAYQTARKLPKDFSPTPPTSAQQQMIAPAIQSTQSSLEIIQLTSPELIEDIPTVNMNSKRNTHFRFTEPTRPHLCDLNYTTYPDMGYNISCTHTGCKKPSLKISLDKFNNDPDTLYTVTNIGQAGRKISLALEALLNETVDIKEATLGFRSIYKILLLIVINYQYMDFIPGPIMSTALYRALVLPDELFDEGPSPQVPVRNAHETEAAATGLIEDAWSYSLRAHDLAKKWAAREKMIMAATATIRPKWEKLRDLDCACDITDGIPLGSTFSPHVAKALWKGLPLTIRDRIFQEFPDTLPSPDHMKSREEKEDDWSNEDAFMTTSQERLEGRLLVAEIYPNEEDFDSDIDI